MGFLKEEFGTFEVLIVFWVVNWKMYGTQKFSRVRTRGHEFGVSERRRIL